MKKAARRIVEKLRLHGYEAFFAGGWVRDFLLHRKAKDIDIATAALPDEVRRLFPNSKAIGAQFGVVQVFSYGRNYDVATFRSDHDYRDGRHPRSVVFSGPEQDALRRDFTINGLFYDPVESRLIDYVHGRKDIQAKLIRTIGNPGERFSEDKLRMLRAIRLACDLGFTIVPETWRAIRELAPVILQVSWERIRDEMTRIFTGTAAATGLDLLHASGLLRQVAPEIEALSGIRQSPEPALEADRLSHTRMTLSLLKKPSAVLAMATLLQDVGKPTVYASEEHQPIEQHARVGGAIAEKICRRLRLSNDEIGRISELVATQSEFANVQRMRESTLQRFLRKAHFEDHLELYRVNCISRKQDLDLYTYCLSKFEESRQQPASVPLVNGQDLIAMGYAPGPLFRAILESIEDMQLEGALRTREEALDYIKSAFPKNETAQPE
jgi:poly(A) polymerase